jgi:hypothetical protein
MSNYSTCAAALRLRSPRFSASAEAPADKAGVPAAKMTVPFGPVIPSVAILIALAILIGATPVQLRAGGYALAAGAVLFVIAVLGHRSPGGGGAPWRKA